MERNPRQRAATTIVAGSMALRNRQVVTSVFHGARPRETNRDRLARLQMSQQLVEWRPPVLPLLPPTPPPPPSTPQELDPYQEPASSSSSETRSPVRFNATSDEEDQERSEPEVPVKMEEVEQIEGFEASEVVEDPGERNIPKAVEVVTLSDGEESREAPERSPSVEILAAYIVEKPQTPEAPEAVADASNDSMTSENSIIPEDPTSSEAPLPVCEAPVAQEAPEALADPEDPMASAPATSEALEAPEPLEAPDAEPMDIDDDGPPVLEIQIPKDSGDLVIPMKEEEKPDLGGGILMQADQKLPIAPVRKSRRINREQNEQKVEDELLSNFHNGQGVKSRGTIIPIGLKRQPFQLNQQSADKKADRAKDQLKINMEPVFTPAGALSQGFPAKESPPLSRKRATPEPAHGFMLTSRCPQIRVGEEFQADIQPMHPARFAEEEPDRDVCTWTPPEPAIECHYDDLYNVYWRAIWRQFEGQIPFETALEQLMKSRYIFSEALNTIDKTMIGLPQAFKPICVAQARLLNGLIKKNIKTRRAIQQTAMKNYHISEVHEYHQRWLKFYKYPRKHIFCNCWFVQCADLAYEPRWACANCTYHLRPQKQPTEESELCLICQTIQTLTGTLRNSETVTFNDFEQAKIQEWAEFEQEIGGPLNRNEYETLAKSREVERWKNDDLTAEEREMLDHSKLKIQNRRGKLTLTPEELKMRGELIADQLEPFILPHFTKCACQPELEGPRDVKNQIAADDLRAALDHWKGNVRLAAAELGVSLVQMKEYLVGKGAEEGFKKEADEVLLNGFPMLNVPPQWPDVPPKSRKNSKSRDTSPDDKAPKAKRRRV